MGFLRTIVMFSWALATLPYLLLIAIVDARLSLNPMIFRLDTEYVGKDFFSEFNWETFDDPTHGRVNYVDLGTAQANNLTTASCDSFVMRADSVNKVSMNSRGRDSIRITSHKSFKDSVTVLDVQHIPWGCATWPAFWTLSSSSSWPYGGEIDIIEGVNEDTANLVSLHTSPGCVMLSEPPQSSESTVISTNCNAFDNFNQGCGTSLANNSYGQGFNSGGGGWYVMKRTQSDGVYVWFWGRNDPTVPPEIRFGAMDIHAIPATWGIPAVRFPQNPDCNFASHFNEHQIIFDLTFCGDWAGAVYNSEACGNKTCVDLVNNYPEAFKDAYWEINALKVYTPLTQSIMVDL